MLYIIGVYRKTISIGGADHVMDAAQRCTYIAIRWEDGILQRSKENVCEVHNFRGVWGHVYMHECKADYEEPTCTCKASTGFSNVH